MEGKYGRTLSIPEQLYSSNIQRDQMSIESCVTQSIIDEVHS